MRRRRYVPVVPEARAVDPARARLPWFDAIWERLPVSARRAFKRVAQGESQEGIDEDDFAALAAQELLSLDGDGLAAVPPSAEHFADRIARLADYPVLFGSPRDFSAMFADSPQPPPLVGVALMNALGRPLQPNATIEHPEAVGVIQSVDWLRHMPPMIERLPGVQRALGLLAANVGLLPIARLAEEVGAEAYPALDTLVSHFVVFEGLDPKTLRLMVGLLPALRGGDGIDLDPDESYPDPEYVPESARPAPSPPPKKKAKEKTEKAPKPAADLALPAPPAPVPRPRQLDVTGAPLVVEDLEALLVALAGRRVRISQRGEAYVEDEAALIEAALGSRPSPLLSPLARATFALRIAERTGLTQGVSSGGVTLLRPAEAAAQDWLEWPLARRWRSIVGMLLDTNRQDWLGGALDQSARSLGPWPPEPTAAALTLAPFVDLAAGAFQPLEALLARWRGELNPLYRLLLARMKQRGIDGQTHPHLLVSQLRYVLDDPELARDPLGALDRAYARGVRALLARLSQIGGVEVADALGDEAIFALTEVGRFYLGFEKRFPRLDETADAPARVVVQPNLEVLVIGRAPAAQLALSRIATAKEGESGPARTFVLTRERVIEAIAHGAEPDSIAATLVEAAQGADVPPNVVRTLNDWARAVRRVKVVHVPVLVCDDEETALTIRSHAGKGVLVADHGVPVDPTKLAAFKRTLLKKGIVVDDDSRDDRRRRR